MREAGPQGLPVRVLCGATSGRILLLLAVLFAAKPQGASAQAVRTNPGFTTTSIPRNDDGSFPTAVPLGFTVNFFGVTDSSVFVNNNGNVTFGGPLSTFTPEGLRASPLRIIAPFWADVDTRAAGSALVTFGRDTVNGRPAFGVNYVNVGYFGTHDDKLNSFQLVLIDRTDLGAGNFDIEFNYDRIDWETGDASGGSGGLGGVSASAGYSNGTGKPEGSFEILGSRRNGLFLDSSRFGLRYRTLNSNLRGRLVFFVRSGSVDCTYSALTIDEPFPWQGGNGVVQVAAPGDCAWTAVSLSSFVTITGEANRSGSSDVEYVVAENRGPARSGTLLIAGQTIQVLQDGFVTLRVNPPSLNISSLEGAFPTRVALRLEAIRDPVNWAASVALQDGAGWQLTVSPPSGTVAPLQPATLILELRRGLLAPVPSVAALTVRDTVNGPSVTVQVILGVGELSDRLLLSQSAFVFRASQGGPAPASQTLRLLNSGQGSLNWTIPAGALPSWLNFSSLAGVALPGTLPPSSTTLTVNPAGLAAGVYQAVAQVSASGASNDPQPVSVTLHVVPTDTAAAAELSPKAMVLTTPLGEAPAAQTLTVSNLGGGVLTFQLASSTVSGGNWLGLSAAGGSAGEGPATVQVTANPAGLQVGIYRGSITAAFSSGGNQEVQVMLVVTPAGSRTLLGGTACVPQGMDLAVTSVGNGASLAVSFPLPLLARIVDTCGRSVNDATVLVDVAGVTIVLRPVGNGLYSGTWTPERAAPSVAVSFTAMHPSYGNVQRGFTVTTTDAPGGVALPAIVTDGVVEAAGFTPQRPLAPGGIISVFGSRLASAEAFAETVPLPRQLGGTSVQIGGEDAPLYYVGPGQINAQVPFTARPGNTVAIVVNAGAQRTAPQNYLIAPMQPGIFHSDGIAVALDARSSPITAQNPARLGEIVQIFATGLGLVDPGAETGASSPPSSAVRNPVKVTLGGVEVPVVYQGLAPGFVGLYQVNVLLSPSVTPGEAVPVVIKQGGVSSNAVSLPVRAPGE